MPVGKWHKDLAVYRDIYTTFIIEGNIHDKQLWTDETDGTCVPTTLPQYLNRFLSKAGYDPVVFYNRIDGFSNPFKPQMTATFFKSLSVDENNTSSICSAMDAIRKAMSNDIRPTAVVVDLANTIVGLPDNLTDEEIEHFTKLMLASKTKVQALSLQDKQPLTNLLFLLVEKVNDIPTWFYLNNPYVRTLTITKPDKEVREAVVSARLGVLAGEKYLSPSERQQVIREGVSLTDGMTLVELFGIFSLCHQKKYSVWQIKDAVKMFRFGETESQWDKLDKSRVKGARQFLSERVKGQPYAVNKAASVLSRASLNMTAIQGGSSSKPRGVLFLAGPTGTGKTELAKTISEFIFGDSSFLTRFDMSEYQQPHSDQKLLGAPPGYVGYSEGGQLTNAIKAKPFCVLLFDEIDKAHPTILNKFLQILDDGRITDSAGETMYFSEAFIIFTSNLGVVGIDSQTRERYQTITPDMEYGEIQSRLLSAIQDYFKFEIRSPELLNRLGDNIVVFDYIRETAALQILDMKLKAVENYMKHEKSVTLSISEKYRGFMKNRALADLSNGGRGIGNMVETYLITPLSDVLLKEQWNSGYCIEVNAPVTDEDGIPFQYRIVQRGMTAL